MIVSWSYSHLGYDCEAIKHGRFALRRFRLRWFRQFWQKQLLNESSLCFGGKLKWPNNNRNKRPTNCNNLLPTWNLAHKSRQKALLVFDLYGSLAVRRNSNKHLQRITIGPPRLKCETFRHWGFVLCLKAVVMIIVTVGHHIKMRTGWSSNLCSTLGSHFKIHSFPLLMISEYCQ